DLCRARSGAGAHRSGQLRRGGPHGRRRRERQARRFDAHHLRRQRQHWQVQLPCLEARAWPLFARHSRRRLRLRWPDDGGRRRRPAPPPPADIKLRPTRNLAKQLTNAEWLASFPGTDTQKKALLNCIGCHDLDRIVTSTHDADEFVQVFDRMTGYYPGSTPQYPQRLIRDARRHPGAAAGVKAMADYLASINLSKDEIWDYPLKTLPRPQGRATRVAITEYDLPRKQIQPHDAIVDSDGMVWFTHFGEQFLGKLDPKT